MDPEVKMTPKRMTQTAMVSFMIPQTKEERRGAIKPNPNMGTDMSASPALKPRRKTKPSRRMAQESEMKAKMMPGKVNTIANMYETKKPVIEIGAEPEYLLYSDNNTSMCGRQTGYTEPGSSRQDPEMALQIKPAPALSAQPMARRQGGQVTRESGAEPIAALMTGTALTGVGGSHLVTEKIQKQFETQK